jgi:hypothetical protein
MRLIVLGTALHTDNAADQTMRWSTIASFPHPPPHDIQCSDSIVILSFELLWDLTRSEQKKEDEEKEQLIQRPNKKKKKTLISEVSE